MLINSFPYTIRSALFSLQVFYDFFYDHFPLVYRHEMQIDHFFIASVSIYRFFYLYSKINRSYGCLKNKAKEESVGRNSFVFALLEFI